MVGGKEMDEAHFSHLILFLSLLFFTGDLFPSKGLHLSIRRFSGDLASGHTGDFLFSRMGHAYVNGCFLWRCRLSNRPI